MGKLSKTKLMQKVLLQRLVIAEGNMVQWASVDGFLGEEMVYRLGQAIAIRDHDTHKAHEYHDKRIHCLEQALRILKTCPACGPEDEHAKADNETSK